MHRLTLNTQLTEQIHFKIQLKKKKKKEEKKKTSLLQRTGGKAGAAAAGAAAAAAAEELPPFPAVLVGMRSRTLRFATFTSFTVDL
jgi:hypothetical protein